MEAIADVWIGESLTTKLNGVAIAPSNLSTLLGAEDEKMKKAYCDKCGVEITSQNVFKDIKTEVAGVTFAMRMENAVPIEYDVCKYCVIDSVASQDDRPRCA